MGNNQNHVLTLLSKQMAIKADLFEALQDGNVYRLHYSPYYDKIVSAKWYGHVKLQQIREQLEKRIQVQRNLPENIPALMAEAWDFTLTDIESNRKGRLTQHQHNLIHHELTVIVSVQNESSPNLDTPVEKVVGRYEPRYDKWDRSIVENTNLEIIIGGVNTRIQSNSQRMGLLGLNTQSVYTMYYVLDKRLEHNRLVSIEISA